MLLLLYLGVKAQTYCMFLEKKTILKIWLKSSVKINHLSRNHELELVATDLFTLWRCVNLNRPFPSSPGLCFKTTVGVQPLIWKSFFISTQIKLIFRKKGCAPSLILKVRVFGTRKWVAYSIPFYYCHQVPTQGHSGSQRAPRPCCFCFQVLSVLHQSPARHLSIFQIHATRCARHSMLHSAEDCCLTFSGELCFALEYLWNVLARLKRKGAFKNDLKSWSSFIQQKLN